MFPLALGLAATAKPVIALFAGQQYEQGWPILATLSIFGLVYGVSPAFSNILLIYGKTRIILLLNLASVAISLILLPAIQILGLTGLALIRGISLTSTFALTIHYISKIVKVEIDREATWKALTSSATMTLAVLAVQQIGHSKLLLPLYVAVGAATYIIALRALKTVKREDTKLVEELAGERAARYLAKILCRKPT